MVDEILTLATPRTQARFFAGPEKLSKRSTHAPLIRLCSFRSSSDQALTCPEAPGARRGAPARGHDRRAAPGLDSERLQSLGPSPLERLSAREAEEAVKAALLTLPEPAREILIMRHYEDLSYAEIAESLGVPEGTVMSRLFRARRALTAALRGQDLGADP